MPKENSYRYGTPSIDEWPNMWKSSAADPDCSAEEFDRVQHDFWKRLNKYEAQGFDRSSVEFLGSNPAGDRTLYLLLFSPEGLTVELVHAVQNWLSEPAYRQWRVFVDTGCDGRRIMIYPSVIRFGRLEGGKTPESAVRDIVAAMRRREAQKARKQSARDS